MHNTAEDGSVKRNDKFSANYDNFIQYLSDCGLNSSVFNDFTMYSKMILNPLSHDNSGSPIFRKEVEAVFGILSEFDDISNEVVKSVSETKSPIMLLAIQSSNKDWHNYKFLVLDNLRRIKQKDKIGYAPCRFKPFKYRKNSELWIEIDEKPMEMRTLYKVICERHESESLYFADAYKNNKNVTLTEMKK